MLGEEDAETLAETDRDAFGGGLVHDGASGGRRSPGCSGGRGRRREARVAHLLQPSPKEDEGPSEDEEEEEEEDAALVPGGDAGEGGAGYVGFASAGAAMAAMEGGDSADSDDAVLTGEPEEPGDDDEDARTEARGRAAEQSSFGVVRTRPGRSRGGVLRRRRRPRPLLAAEVAGAVPEELLRWRARASPRPSRRGRTPTGRARFGSARFWGRGSTPASCRTTCEERRRSGEEGGCGGGERREGAGAGEGEDGSRHSFFTDWYPVPDDHFPTSFASSRRRAAGHQQHVANKFARRRETDAPPPRRRRAPCRRRRGSVARVALARSAGRRASAPFRASSAPLRAPPPRRRRSTPRLPRRDPATGAALFAFVRPRAFRRSRSRRSRHAEELHRRRTRIDVRFDGASGGRGGSPGEAREAPQVGCGTATTTRASPAEAGGGDDGPSSTNLVETGTTSRRDGVQRVQLHVRHHVRQARTAPPAARH